jgi:hypothetical protein
MNVEFAAFHEGRGAGKSTTPGGREKNAYFQKEGFLEKSWKGWGLFTDAAWPINGVGWILHCSGV